MCRKMTRFGMEVLIRIYRFSKKSCWECLILFYFNCDIQEVEPLLNLYNSTFAIRQSQINDETGLCQSVGLVLYNYHCWLSFLHFRAGSPTYFKPIPFSQCIPLTVTNLLRHPIDQPKTKLTFGPPIHSFVQENTA